MTAFVFPGQGSQRRGMGQGLFDEVGEFSAVESEVDATLGYSLREMCLEDSGNRLKETQYTQPCLYVVNALHYYKTAYQSARPAYLAGHSLGEYNALLAAGVFDFLTGLKLVKKRGELMSQAKNGGMAAIIGMSSNTIKKTLVEQRMETLDVANFNSPSQTVISGPVEDIRRAGQIFEKLGVRMYLPLPVSAAFHSRYMTPAARAFGEFLAPMSFAMPKIPVIANVTAQPYPSNNPSDAVKSLLTRQIDHSVLWVQSVHHLLNEGVTQFTEMGPGNVLTRTIQEIRQEKGSPSLMTTVQ